MEPGGGASQAALFRHGPKIAQVMKIKPFHAARVYFGLT
jgi:hypothetical protein